VFTIGAVQGSYPGVNATRSYELHFIQAEHPERIILNGNELPQSDTGEEISWYFEDEKNKLIIRIPETERHKKLDFDIVLDQN
ncbi:MAG: hypothetical protein ACFCU6_14480, partial [Balneolaceae bacterium]